MKAITVSEKAIKYTNYLSQYLDSEDSADEEMQLIAIYNYSNPEEYMVYDTTIEMIYYIIDLLSAAYEHITFVYDIITN